MSMRRTRAQIDGGYTRKTLSLPTYLVEEVDKLLKRQPGMTMSMFVTTAVEHAIDSEITKRRT